MTKPKQTTKRKRTPAQAEAEATYAASHEVIQVNLKWKAADDLKMFKALRDRFPDLTDPAIVRMAVKKLAAKGNR